MRKNGVNRELREIDGGVCAPAGFRANGIHCGFTKNAEKKDLALIVSDRRCPTACVFSVDSKQSGPACVSKKHLKNGLARAILVNSGVANVFLPDGERLAELACRALAARSDIDANDTVIASTGKVGEPLSLSTFEDGLRPLAQGLSATEEGSLFAAQAMMTTDTYAKHTAFAFDLGDFPCKIGVAFKGNTRVCPNMATTLIFLTTDVNISSEMLQKALSLTVKDTVNLLCADGASSPNDTVCIMANGKAGNYKISCEDTEFSKFTYALRKVLSEICMRIVQDCDVDNRVFVCNVTGAKSSQVARTAAKNLVSSESVRRCILQAKSGVESMLYALNCAEGDADYSKVEISINGGENTYVLYEEGIALRIHTENLRRLSDAKEILLFVRLNDGNYSATAVGCLQPEYFT
ncbi:MAG: bifunctional ornithine acetyltransferase/N-acetylglutamate synthase [Clostridia bacterium]|nr:bifunctional ornithine acetyltransferase/N-acetylglutamate synthase [Clostridia bacterium]